MAKNNQAVLLPAFFSSLLRTSADNVSLGIFRNFDSKLE
jgi:hypothetical protein